MNNERFEKSKIIKYRITLLKGFNDYLKVLFIGEMMSVKMEIEMFGEKSHQYLMPMGSPTSTYLGMDDEDKELFATTIKSQIEKLEKEFESI